MILSAKPKLGAILAASGTRKPAFVQEMATAGPPEFDSKSYMQDGAVMAAQRLIDAIHGRDAAGVVAALRNLDALIDCADETSAME